MSADLSTCGRIRIALDGAALDVAFNDIPAAGDPRGVLLYLHGFIASRRHWRPTIERLRASGWRQIAIDLPGFGDSGMLPRPHRLPDYADAVAAVCAALGVRPVVVGHSFGGMVAVDLADRHPERVEALVLVAPAGIAHPHHRIPAWVRVPLLRDVIIGAVTTRWIGRWYFRGVAETLAGLSDEEVDDLRFGVRRCREVRRMRAFYRMPHFLDALARLRAPAGLIWGDRDRVVPAADAGPILDALRRRPAAVGRTDEVPFVRMPGVGHLPMHEDRDGFADALRAVLSRVAGRLPRVEGGDAG